MKYGNTYYLQLTREIFSDKYSFLSNGAKWLFVWLNELEHKFTGAEKDFFFRTDQELAKDLCVTLPTLRKYKAELKETDLVEMWLSPFIDTETNKRTSRHVTCYRIIK